MSPIGSLGSLDNALMSEIIILMKNKADATEVTKLRIDKTNKIDSHA